MIGNMPIPDWMRRLSPTARRADTDRMLDFVAQLRHEFDQPAPPPTPPMAAAQHAAVDALVYAARRRGVHVRA